LVAGRRERDQGVQWTEVRGCFASVRIQKDLIRKKKAKLSEKQQTERKKGRSQSRHRDLRTQTTKGKSGRIK